MKKVILFILLLSALASCTSAQDKITTLILVRHAEKANDGSKDPALTENGLARAEELVRILKETKIDAIYSTPFVRTMATVQPLATAKGLSIVTYEPMKGEEMDRVLEKHNGETIVISGHSNTTPWVINYFLGEKEVADFSDSDYDNLLILSVITKGNAKLTWLNYGNESH